MADDEIAEEDNDWTQWDRERLLIYLRSKWPLDEAEASLDINQLANRTVLDLTPENRDGLSRIFTKLTNAVNTQFTESGGLRETIEQSLVTELLSRAKKTAKCPTDDMRTLFLKEINGRKPATLQALYVAILKAFNMYEKAKKQYGKYGLLARDNAVKAMLSNTEEEEKGGNSNFKTNVQGKAGKQEHQKQGKNRKDYSKACAACGRNGHKAGRDSCYFVSANHPDYNTDWKTLSFEKSNKGKAWMAKGKPEIPHGLTLSGKNWEPKISFQEWRKKRAPDSEDTENPSKRQKKGNNFTTNHNCHLLDETESSPVSEAHTLHCGIITPQKKSYVDILVDTGSLQGNYLSADVAQWLRHQGVEEFFEKIKVCSFKGCETVNSYFLVDFSFLDKISGKIIIIEKILVITKLPL
jgi:hypothetical protein